MEFENPHNILGQLQRSGALLNGTTRFQRVPQPDKLISNIDIIVVVAPSNVYCVPKCADVKSVGKCFEDPIVVPQINQRPSDHNVSRILRPNSSIFIYTQGFTVGAYLCPKGVCVPCDSQGNSFGQYARPLFFAKIIRYFEFKGDITRIGIAE